MPTAFWADGFRFFFYSNEGNEPAHIHVERGDGEAKFWLDPVECQAAHGFKRQELGQIAGIITERRAELKEKWDEHASKK